MAKRVSKKIRKRKRILKFILILIGIGIFVYFWVNNKTFLSSVDYTNEGDITYYDIYGIHMNFEGSFKLDDGFSNPKLVLANGSDEKVIEWDLFEDGDGYSFKTSKYINDGINLEELENGTYYLLKKY